MKKNPELKNVDLFVTASSSKKSVEPVEVATVQKEDDPVPDLIALGKVITNELSKKKASKPEATSQAKIFERNKVEANRSSIASVQILSHINGSLESNENAEEKRHKKLIEAIEKSGNKGDFNLLNSGGLFGGRGKKGKNKGSTKGKSKDGSGAVVGKGGTKKTASAKSKLSKVTGAGKGLLRRIPLLGALIAGGSILNSEMDDSLTRGEKNSSIGSNAGMAGGALGGAAMGAAIGTAIVPVIGTVIGGAIGAFLGGSLGEIIGKEAAEFFDSKIWRGLSTELSSKWYEVTSSLSNFTDDVNSWFKDKTGVDVKAKASKIYNKASESVANDNSFLGGIRKKGESIGKSVKDWFSDEDQSSEFNQKKGKFSEVDAALNFKGGSSIMGLNEAETRALASNTMKTESAGKVNALNPWGYAGQYQFGAQALADDGLVDKKKLKTARDSMSKKDWWRKKNGGHRQFIENPANWKLEGGLESFLQDKELQDKAFVRYTNRNIKQGLKSGALNGSSKSGRVAGYAKAAHLKGAGGANKLFLRGVNSRDANGTSTAKYAADASVAMNNLAPVVEGALAKKREAVNIPPPPFMESQAYPAGTIFDYNKMKSVPNATATTKIAKAVGSSAISSRTIAPVVQKTPPAPKQLPVSPVVSKVEDMKKGKIPTSSQPVIDEARLARLIGAEVAKRDKSKEKGLSNLDQGFASHIPTDFDDQYLVLMANGLV